MLMKLSRQKSGTRDINDLKHYVGVFFPQKDSNIASWNKSKKGDLEKAFEESDLQVVMNSHFQPLLMFHGNPRGNWFRQTPSRIRSEFGHPLNRPSPSARSWQIVLAS
jgi:hypothetical protein